MRVLCRVVHTGTAARLRSPCAVPLGTCVLVIAAETFLALLTCPRVRIGRGANEVGLLESESKLLLMSV